MAKFLAILLVLALTFSTTSSFAETNPSGFTNSVNVSSNAGDSITPQMVVSGNSVYIAWVGNIAGKSDIFFAKSADSGSTFTTPTNLGSISTGSSGDPVLAVSDDKVYLAWESKYGNSTIFFTKSSDGGSTFDKPFNISESSKDSVLPQIAASGNHVYVAWIERTGENKTKIVFSKSDNSGETFDKPVNIGNHGGVSGIPKLSADGNDVYIIWEDNGLGNFDVYLSKSSDGGITFSTPVNISNDSGNSGTPQIALSGKNIYITWMDDTPGNFDIFFAKSSDGGLTFSKPRNVSNDIFDSGYPQLAVSGSNIYIVWTATEPNNNYDIAFTMSGDGGKAFSKPINISKNAGDSGWAQIAVDGDIYVSWLDKTPGNFDVFITKSHDGGATFESAINISNTKGESYFNKMVVNSNTVYMVWQEANKGKHDIMFSKSTTFVPEFGPIVPLILVASMASLIIVSKRSSLRTYI